MLILKGKATKTNMSEHYKQPDLQIPIEGVEAQEQALSTERPEVLMADSHEESEPLPEEAYVKRSEESGGGVERWKVVGKDEKGNFILESPTEVQSMQINPETGKKELMSGVGRRIVRPEALSSEVQASLSKDFLDQEQTEARRAAERIVDGEASTEKDEIEVRIEALGEELKVLEDRYDRLVGNLSNKVKTALWQMRVGWQAEGGPKFHEIANADKKLPHEIRSDREFKSEFEQVVLRILAAKNAMVDLKSSEN